MTSRVGLLLMLASLTGLIQSAPSSRNLLEAEGSVSPQISNGRRARPGQFSYSVTVWANKTGTMEYINCGGALVSKSVVATTVYCLAELFEFASDVQQWLDGEPVLMYNASVRVGQTTIMQSKVARRDVVDIRVHPNLRESFDDPLQYNLALFRLSRPVKGVRIPPLASKSMKFKPERPLHIMGFGQVAPDKDRVSSTLRYATVRKMSLRACDAQIDRWKTIVGFPIEINLGNTTFCTGTIAGKAALEGDMGFPVVTRGRNPVLVGLVGLLDLWSSTLLPNLVTPFNINTDLTGGLGTWAKSAIADMEAEAKEERKARKAARRAARKNR